MGTWRITRPLAFSLHLLWKVTWCLVPGPISINVHKISIGQGRKFFTINQYYFKKLLNLSCIPKSKLAPTPYSTIVHLSDWNTMPWNFRVNQMEFRTLNRHQMGRAVWKPVWNNKHGIVMLHLSTQSRTYALWVEFPISKVEEYWNNHHAIKQLCWFINVKMFPIYWNHLHTHIWGEFLTPFPTLWELVNVEAMCIYWIEIQLWIY